MGKTKIVCPYCQKEISIKIVFDELKENMLKSMGLSKYEVTEDREKFFAFENEGTSKQFDKRGGYKMEKREKK